MPSMDVLDYNSSAMMHKDALKGKQNLQETVGLHGENRNTDDSDTPTSASGSWQSSFDDLSEGGDLVQSQDCAAESDLESLPGSCDGNTSESHKTLKNLDWAECEKESTETETTGIDEDSDNQDQEEGSSSGNFVLSATKTEGRVHYKTTLNVESNNCFALDLEYRYKPTGESGWFGAVTTLCGEIMMKCENKHHNVCGQNEAFLFVKHGYQHLWTTASSQKAYFDTGCMTLEMKMIMGGERLMSAEIPKLFDNEKFPTKLF
eukprot:Selendium_serpulae@DN5792_c0_g1_i1.p1